MIKRLNTFVNKVFLQLPSSLYRLKLSTIELDSFEASRMTIQTKKVSNADFLNEFSILRQNYALPPLDQFNTLILNIENSLKDVYSLEGDESAFLEIILINNILLFICEKVDDIVKLMEKVRETLFSLTKCPLEVISVMQLFAGLLFERENIIESEKEYLMSIIHYFNVTSDPRGRGSYSSNYLLGLAWKSSMIAHYHKKMIDAELCEEILDAAFYNIMHARERVQDSRYTANHGNVGEDKKWNKVFDEAPIKNKFVKSVRKSPTRNKNETNDKINIDDIDIEMLSQYQNESGDPFDDVMYLVNENRFLFYHWNTQKSRYEDIEDYMEYGAGNQLDFFIWLLRCNPWMFMSGIKFTNTQIREFTFSDGVNNMLSLKSASSIMSGIHNMSSSLSMESYSSSAGNQSTKEKRQKAFHHGAYQHILNKDHYAMSRSEWNGVVYVWGTDVKGQLGSSNIANLKSSENDSEEFRRNYPRILIGLKDLIIKEVCCGNEHSLAVTIEGNLWAWGHNDVTQLGIGTTAGSYINQPERVYGISNIKQISCGYEHSAALNDSGELYTWGQGQGGILGHGDLENQPTPKKVEYFVNKHLEVTKICCGGLHNMAIAGDGDLFTWGRGDGLQIGIAQKIINEMEDFELGFSTPIPIIKDKTIIDVAAGVAHSLALTDNGKVYCWGHGNYGQLGLGLSGESFEPGTGDAQCAVFEPTLNFNLNKINIIRIYAGSTFSMFLSDDKELYAWGTNDLGQCGIDTAHEELKAFEKIKDGHKHNLETNLDINIPRKLEWFSMMNVETVSWGENHSFAVINSDLNNKKMLWGWGMFKQGQLGLGDLKKRINPRPVQTLYNTNIQADKVSWGNSSTLWILGDPNNFVIPDSQPINNESPVSSSVRGLENDIWNIIEHREEENYDEEEMMEK